MGDIREISNSGNDNFFFTGTPSRLTSSGRDDVASETRFWVSTLAMSRSEPTSKDTSRLMRPSLELVEFM